LSDELSKVLWVEPKAKPAPPETRVEDALQRALDATTPARPGVPWDENTEKIEEYYVITGSEE